MSDIFDRLFSLRGKTALVTGGSRGIGLAIAEGLAEAGAHVVALGRSETPEYTVVVEYRRCDITDEKAFAEICCAVAESTGHIDVYVHAAGITLPDQAQKSPLEVFERTIASNLTAAYSCALAVLPHMIKAGGGAIINVTSIGAELGFPGNPGYVASKGGLRMLSKALAVDAARYNIRVNNLAPGYIHTAMTEASFSDPTRNQERVRRMLVPRWGTPQDLVGAAIFLASDASAYVTGVDLYVDGGWTAKGL